MTEEEAIKRLKNCPADDPESAHVEADRILLEFLYANGFKGVADEWSAAEDRCHGFWYA